MTEPQPDIAAYCERVGYLGERTVGLSLLRALHLAHLGAIPFENIDVRLGRGVALDLETLQDKLVRRRRGGYCFEQNGLFAAILRALGFEVATLEARVRPPDATRVLPRTHMVLRVSLGDRSYLADVGFGGDGPLTPVPLDGEVSEQADGDYRVTTDSSEIRVLRRRGAGGWQDLYAFSLLPALPVDFEVANHYTATHPDSVFRNRLTVQRSLPGERRILRGSDYLVRRGHEETHREIRSAELESLLERAFGLQLSASDRRALKAVSETA